MTTIGVPPRSPGDWDWPADEVAADAARLAARRKVEARAEDLRYLVAHPDRFATPAPDGLLAEYRHLLHDADPDSTVPPLRVDLTKTQPREGS